MVTVMCHRCRAALTYYYHRPRVRAKDRAD